MQHWDQGKYHTEFIIKIGRCNNKTFTIYPLFTSAQPSKKYILRNSDIITLKWPERWKQIMDEIETKMIKAWSRIVKWNWKAIWNHTHKLSRK